MFLSDISKDDITYAIINLSVSIFSQKKNTLLIRQHNTKHPHLLSKQNKTNFHRKESKSFFIGHYPIPFDVIFNRRPVKRPHKSSTIHEPSTLIYLH